LKVGRHLANAPPRVRRTEKSSEQALRASAWKRVIDAYANTRFLAPVGDR
jgi:hypothetical protein